MIKFAEFLVPLYEPMYKAFYDIVENFKKIQIFYIWKGVQNTLFQCLWCHIMIFFHTFHALPKLKVPNC